MTVKTIYAQTRREGMSRETFVHRWRRHAALAMTQPGFWDPVVRYIQSDRLSDSSGFPVTGNAYVGVGEIHYSDIAERTRSKRSVELETILHPDASEFFRRQDQIHIGVEDIYLLRGRYAPVKIYGFVSRTPESQKETFFTEWMELQSRIMAEARSSHLLRRLVCGRGLEGGAGADGTVELSFDSVNDAATFYNEWASRVAATVFNTVRPDSIVVVPAFVSLFYDRRYYEG
ncbi:MAG: EthD domain-containing protein [Pseudomonadota bacterium]